MSEVTAAIFRDGRVVQHVPLDASAPQYGASEFIWIEALDPDASDLAILKERFHLHCLAVEESMAAARVPKVDLFDGQIFVVLKTAWLESDVIRYAEIDTFVSAHHVITVRRAGHRRDDEAYARLQKVPRPFPLMPDFVLHSILEVTVNDYFPVVQMIEDEVLGMEQHLQDALLDREEINRLFRLRRGQASRPAICWNKNARASSRGSSRRGPRYWACLRLLPASTAPRRQTCRSSMHTSQTASSSP